MYVYIYVYACACVWLAAHGTNGQWRGHVPSFWHKRSAGRLGRGGADDSPAEAAPWPATRALAAKGSGWARPWQPTARLGIAKGERGGGGEPAPWPAARALAARGMLAAKEGEGGGGGGEPGFLPHARRGPKGGAEGGGRRGQTWENTGKH